MREQEIDIGKKKNKKCTKIKKIKTKKVEKPERKLITNRKKDNEQGPNLKKHEILKV